MSINKQEIINVELIFYCIQLYFIIGKKNYNQNIKFKVGIRYLE